MTRASSTTARASGTTAESSQQQLKIEGELTLKQETEGEGGLEKCARDKFHPKPSDVDSLLIVRVSYDQQDKHVEKHCLRSFPSRENE